MFPFKLNQFFLICFSVSGLLRNKGDGKLRALFWIACEATASTGSDRWTSRVMSTELKLWHDGLCTFVVALRRKKKKVR
jgi:hypothetical protein